MDIQAYPLTWPLRLARTKFRRTSKFGKRSIGDASEEVLRQVRMLGGTRIVISSNLRLRQDGMPFSVQAQPVDTGVAVYFRLKNADICLPCDVWDKAEHNLWAIAKDVEAQRGRLRWGVGSLEQAFAGYAALPPPSSAAENCWTVLGLAFGSTPAQINEAYRALSLERHPDRGGSAESMAALNQARTEALKVAGGRP